jgi:hypothetical protein
LLTPIQHCSISAPSICTQQYIRQYFADGTLPEIGTWCPVIGQPFPNTAQTEDQIRLEAALDMDDRNLLNAVQELSRTFRLSFPL